MTIKQKYALKHLRTYTTAYIDGRTAKALERRGWATYAGYNRRYSATDWTVTSEGLGALAAVEAAEEAKYQERKARHDAQAAEAMAMFSPIR